MALARASALLDSFRAAVTAFPGGAVPKPLADLLTQLKVSWRDLVLSACVIAVALSFLPFS